MTDQAFYTEDVCTLKSDRRSMGIVDRTTNDVDTHTPYPSRDYAHLKCHKDIPSVEWEQFKKTGIPPTNSVLVEWQTKSSVELIPTKHLALIDRALLVGDIVKRNTRDAMSGTVVETEVVCILRPGATKVLMEDTLWNKPHNPAEILYEIPANEITPSNLYQEGSMVIYHDWVGRIEEVVDDITVRLSNNSVVQIENPDDVHVMTKPTDRLEVGDVIRTTKSNIRRGRWLYGSYDAKLEPMGEIVVVCPVAVDIRWLCRRLHSISNGQNHSEPPRRLERDVLENGEIHLYDRSRAPSFHSAVSYGRCVDFLVGNGVRFKDPTGASMKYDGTKAVPGIDHKNHVWIIPRSSTLGFDLNIYTILSMKTKAGILWQDCTFTREDSTNLVPDINLEDESEVWPGEIVVSNESSPVLGQEWILEPKKVGIVQSVSADDRLATVLWLPGAKVQYHSVPDMDEYMPASLLPGSSLGLTLHPHEDVSKLDSTPNAVREDVTLYDIRAADGLNTRRGDFVILHPPEEFGLNATTSLDWIGEVVNLGIDGFLTVRLGALPFVKDVKISPEYATIVYSTDMPTGPPGVDSDYETEDSEEDEEYANSEGSGGWQAANGAPINEDSDADAWSTESEDAAEDAEYGSDMSIDSMSDLIDDTNPRGNIPVLNSHISTSTPNELRTSSPIDQVEEPLDHEFSSMAPKNSTPSRDDSIAPPMLQPNEEIPHVSRVDSAPVSFDVLESAPPDSTPYLTPPPPPLSSQLMKRITKEHRILASSLPEGIFARTWESRLDLLRILIVGPLDTPYEFAPFMIDISLPPTYPRDPPLAYFHSWTNGQGPVNPNLYENGKICLSLLGTWHADGKDENWSPARSTILQVLVSIMGLVLVKEPYYNEAGFEVRAGLADAAVPSALYSERTYFRSRGFIRYALSNQISGFEDVIKWLYLDQSPEAPKLLQRAVDAANEVLNSEETGLKRGGLTRMSKGALVMLKRELKAIEDLKLGP